MTTKKIVAALVFAAAFFFILKYHLLPRTQVTTREHAISNTEINNLEAGRIDDVGASIALLQSQLTALEAQLEQLSANPNLANLPKENHSDVLERLDVLEKNFENIGRDNDEANISAKTRVREEIIENLKPRPIQQVEYTENPEATALFESDSGVQLDEGTEETIVEVFHTSENFNMQQIYCKESVCKITYTKPSNDLLGTVTDADSDFALINQLSEQMGGVDLDVRYARDEQGNQVMYIQQN